MAGELRDMELDRIGWCTVGVRIRRPASYEERNSNEPVIHPYGKYSSFIYETTTEGGGPGETLAATGAAEAIQQQLVHLSVSPDEQR